MTPQIGAARWLDHRAAPFLIGLLFAFTAVGFAAFAGQDASERALLAARWTARASLPFFLVTYLASSLVRLWPNALTRALQRRRRQWGLAFALAMTIHLIALLNNIIMFRPRALMTLIGGGIAYVLMYVMAATSNNRSMRMMGRGWKIIHRIGLHIIWLVFFISYAGRVVHVEPHYHLEGQVGAALLLGALAIRLVAWRRK